MKILLTILIVILFTATVLAIDMNVNMGQINEVIPGNYFNTQFNIINGAIPLTNITFKLDEGSSFSVQGDNEIKYNSILPYQTLTLNYVLKADENTNTGYKSINLVTSTSNDSLKKTFNIYVKNIESTLSITSFRSNPEKLTPGETANLKISINNKASYSLKNINLKLDFTNVPFASINSVSDKNIEYINANSNTEVSFDIITLADTKTGIYKIPLSIIYFDEFGKSYNITSLITLIVGAEPKIELTIDSNKLIENTPSTISIKLVNDGLTNLKFLSIRLAPGDYEILNNENIYVGDIDSDDYSTVEFKLTPKKTNIYLPLTLNYKDANNEDYSKVFSLTSKVYTNSEAKSMGLIPSNTSNYIILGVIVLVIIYIIYRRIRKKRKI